MVFTTKMRKFEDGSRTVTKSIGNSGFSFSVNGPKFSYRCNFYMNYDDSPMCEIYVTQKAEGSITGPEHCVFQGVPWLIPQSIFVTDEPSSISRQALYEDEQQEEDNEREEEEDNS